MPETWAKVLATVPRRIHIFGTAAHSVKRRESNDCDLHHRGCEDPSGAILGVWRMAGTKLGTLGATLPRGTAEEQPMPEPRPDAPQLHRRLLVVAILFASALLIAAGALHLATVTAARPAAEPGNLAERVASAQLAAAIEPWNAEFVRRAKVLRQWQQGRELLDAGDYNESVEALREAYRDDGAIGRSPRSRTPSRQQPART